MRYHVVGEQRLAETIGEVAEVRHVEDRHVVRTPPALRLHTVWPQLTNGATSPHSGDLARWTDLTTQIRPGPAMACPFARARAMQPSTRRAVSVGLARGGRVGEWCSRTHGYCQRLGTAAGLGLAIMRGAGRVLRVWRASTTGGWASTIGTLPQVLAVPYPREKAADAAGPFRVRACPASARWWAGGRHHKHRPRAQRRHHAVAVPARTHARTCS